MCVYFVLIQTRLCDDIVANLFTATRNDRLVNITQPYSARENAEQGRFFFTGNISSGTTLFNCYLLLV
jgi:hypothetical protein